MTDDEQLAKEWRHMIVSDEGDAARQKQGSARQKQGSAAVVVAEEQKQGSAAVVEEQKQGSAAVVVAEAPAVKQRLGMPVIVSAGVKGVKMKVV